MNISSKTKILAIIGNPVSHSKSPEIHNSWAKRFDLDIAYIPFLVQDLKSFMNWVKSSNIAGFNVTIPYKERIIPFLTKLDASVEKIKAVNTVLIQNSHLIGYNTDIDGIAATLDNVIINCKKVLIIGAGGASRAVCAYLSQFRHISTSIINRTEVKAEQLAKEFNLNFITKNKLIADYDLIINTTSVGMGLNESPLMLSNYCHENTFIFDLIYEPDETHFLKQAKQLNLAHCNGYKMLEKQAQRSFEIWTGISPSSL